MAAERNEIFIERFFVAKSKNGAGFIQTIYAKRILFTQDLRFALRHATKDGFASDLFTGKAELQTGERDPKNYQYLAGWAQYGIGAPPKAGK